LNRNSRSTLFLIEQLVVILIFAVCAAVCVSIFVESYMMERRATDVSNALLVAKSGIESYKAFAGDAERTASVLGGVVYSGGDTVTVYYDEHWDLFTEDGAAYILRIAPAGGGHPSLKLVDVTVGTADGDELIALTAAARRASG
jgi:type II secretory pathway pseudopilin PulG